jgi:tRNA pseudouridine38-40 synthase
MGADRRKTNWKVTLAYDGTDFHGWQVQPGSPTIQGTLANAIASVTGEHTLPQGSGRTDAGVHAEGQVASFDLAAPIPAENLQRALNRILPNSIRVLSAEHAPPGFHARHSALLKTYEYRLFLGPVCPPLLSRYVVSCDPALDFEAMQRGASAVLGVHDFTSFAASDPDRTSRMAQLIPMQVEDALGSENRHQPQAARSDRTGNIRRVEISQWSRSEISHFNAGSVLPPGGQLWVYTVRGNGFLHHMVRNLVGSFLEIGHGRLNFSAIPDILAARNRTLAGPTAAARGLCLVNVFYGLPGPVESSGESQ